MAGLGSTLARLGGSRPLPAFGLPIARTDRLRDLTGFGSNPGTLRARTFVPDKLAKGAPLVVVLHGCTQTAAGYDVSSGWSQLAEEYGFALLYPEQQRANNANLCFNWFLLGDARRGRGEALSIRQMIDALVIAHDLDPQRIFVTGLSAGGAMTTVMLASYPEVFAGGAVIAGLPFGNANSVGDALAQMRGRGPLTDAQLSDLARNATDHDGPWPTLSIWHGSADTTVDPSNATRIATQWCALHEVENTLGRKDSVDGCSRTTWHDGQGRAVVELYDIPGMGHGTPLSTVGADACGAIGPHMLEAGISSTRHIAAFWGLTGTLAVAQREATSAKPDARTPVLQRLDKLPPVQPLPTRARPLGGPGAIIEDALRAAGLMR